jgi:hypothetical protein
MISVRSRKAGSVETRESLVMQSYFPAPNYSNDAEQAYSKFGCGAIKSEQSEQSEQNCDGVGLGELLAESGMHRGAISPVCV